MGAAKDTARRQVRLDFGAMAARSRVVVIARPSVPFCGREEILADLQ
jgi:hypothetical protein